MCLTTRKMVFWVGFTCQVSLTPVFVSLKKTEYENAIFESFKQTLRTLKMGDLSTSFE